MEFKSKKESFLVKYSLIALTAAILTVLVLSVYVMPLLLVSQYAGRPMPWYYNIIMLSSLIIISILGFMLVKRFISVYNKINTYNKEIEFKNQALNHMFNEVNTSKNNLDKFSQMLEETVLEKTKSIRTLLDNAGQGFLTFGADLLVDKEYSLECVKIFNQEIYNQKISELIFPNSSEQQELIQSVTSKVLEEKENLRKETYLGLLPTETVLNNKHIQIDYKVITGSIAGQTEAVMLILTDITEKHNLEIQMEEEKNVLKMIVDIIANYPDFIDCVKDYEEFCKVRISDIINTSYSIEDIVLKIYRAIHTFKGSFSQFGLASITANLHKFEFELCELMKISTNMSLDDFNACFSTYNLSEWLEEDLIVLKKTLGESFISNKDVVEIEKQKLLDVEKKMLSLLSPLSCSLIIPDIRKFRYKPFRELLKSYPSYVVTLSDRFQKQVNPLVIEGGEFFVDPDKYTGFTKSLGHVFRNIMEYGIEPWDERIKSGKNTDGNIKCAVELTDKGIKLSIADDGFGIDSDLIRRTAVEKGYFSEYTILELADNEILPLIFCDGFSTNIGITDLSGRGIGLSAVKDEVDRLGGICEVKTTVGVGTKFTFFLPFDSSSNLPDISVSEVMNSLIDTTKNFFEGQVFLTESHCGQRVKKVESLTLKKVSVFIGVKGAINGVFVFTADENLVKNVLDFFIFGPLQSGEDEISVEDVLAECTNMILGNSAKACPLLEDYITLDTPVTMSSGKAFIKHPSAEIWTAYLESDKGNIDISFLSSFK